MVTLQVQNLINFVADVFSHSDSSPEEARRIANYLTTANLTGHDSHGVIRVPVYIRWKKMGSVVPDQTVELVVDTPSLAVVDGNDAEIVLRMLVEILGGNSIATRRRFTRQGEVALEYLVSAAADLDVGSVAVECLIAL